MVTGIVEMMLLSPTDTAATRLAIRRFPQYIGWLITPRVRRLRTSMRQIAGWWAMDNDCFNAQNFDPRKFIAALQLNADIRGRCLFVTAPDVVADAKATLHRFRHWGPSIHGLDYPVALVAQDGLENLAIPWDDFEVLFIGGSTDWKLSPAAVWLIREAKRHDKWVHVGRVNSRQRVLFCHHAGADSIDGTHFAIEPDAALGWVLPLLRSLDKQMGLPMPEKARGLR